MSSKKGMQNVKQQNALEEQADLEAMRRQYNEAQAKAKVLAVAQAQARAQAHAQAQAHTQVGKQTAVNNHETGLATTSSTSLWQSVHETVQPTPMISHSSRMHMVDDHDPHNALNMRLQNTIKSQGLMVRDCVKTKLFRRLNFF
jgi:arginine utilization protein RocB